MAEEPPAFRTLTFIFKKADGGVLLVFTLYLDKLMMESWKAKHDIFPCFAFTSADFMAPWLLAGCKFQFIKVFTSGQ